MTTDIQITRREIVERRWECVRCKTHGNVVLRAEGKSGWQRQGWFDSGQAESRAYSNAEWAVTRDAERIMDMIRCPTCFERAPRARFWSVVRAIPYVIVTAGVGVGAVLMVALLSQLPPWLAPIGVVAGYLGTLQERRRWREADLTVVTDIHPGEKLLPVAVARPARPAPPPKPAAPAPLAPLRTTAPETTERAPESEGPRFLRD